MTFSELNLSPLMVHGLAAVGIREPRAIQAQAIPTIRDGRDVIGLAQTGTGKTAAFLAPVLDGILADRPTGKDDTRFRRPSARLRGLVLCPTRELAQQVERDAASLIGGTVLRTMVAYGKVSLKAQADELARGVDLLVATPGRVRELLDADSIDLSHIQVITIDEADRMLDMGFLPQVEKILARLPLNHQTLLFSATMPAAVEELARRFLRNPIRIEIGRHTTPVDYLQQHLISTIDKTKVPWLVDFIEKQGARGVLVFCRTRRRVGWVAGALHRHGVSVGMLHGDRSQAQRQRALDRFRGGELKVLVATDVAARGLHVPAVRVVVNYDLPMQPEEYVHRIGRAGHGLDAEAQKSLSRSTRSYTLCTPHDADRWERIASAVDVLLELEVIDPFAPPMESDRSRIDPDRRDYSHRRNQGPGRDRTKDVLPDPISRRGKVKRRRGRNRPIDPKQKPGKGVTNRRQDRKKPGGSSGS